jgi:hypothetical protein
VTKDKIILKPGRDQILKGDGKITIDTPDGKLTLERLQLKFARVCDPTTGHGSGEVVLAGKAKYTSDKKYTRKSGK